MTAKKATPIPEPDVEVDEPASPYPAADTWTPEQYEELAASIEGAQVAYSGKHPVGITVTYPFAQRLRP